MVTSKVMETRKRFQEIYGKQEEKDYGSMDNLANAHREYIRNMKEYQNAQNQRRELAAWNWAQHFNNNILPGLAQNLNQNASAGTQPPRNALQMEAATFLRRLLAEFIDFLFFLAFKIFVVGVLIELDLIDLKALGQALEDDQDMMQFINLAQELLPIEIVCKIFCCFLEGLIMAYGMGPVGRGQTPGKWMVGIRVISCRDVTRGDTSDHIVVDRPTYISWQQSMKRSFMKNVVVNSLFPLSTAAFQVSNGRVFYDLVVRTVVVMEPN